MSLYQKSPNTLKKDNPERINQDINEMSTIQFRAHYNRN